MRVYFEDVPKNRLPPILVMGLGPKVDFLGDSGPKAIHENHSFHDGLQFRLSGPCRLASRQDCSATATGRTGFNKNCL